MVTFLRKLLGLPDSTSLGQRGERLAARWLKRRGFRIIERNYRAGKDEADLLAVDPDGVTVVVVEVKTRRENAILPEEQVGLVKQRRLARLAARVQQKREFAGRPLRFDVVAITWPEHGEPAVRHIPAAFDAPF